MKNIRNNFFATYIRNPFSVARSKLSSFTQPKLNTDRDLENYESEYQADINSLQELHPYLIDRVEPSVRHIIFSSYIRY